MHLFQMKRQQNTNIIPRQMYIFIVKVLITWQINNRQKNQITKIQSLINRNRFNWINNQRRLVLLNIVGANVKRSTQTYSIIPITYATFENLTTNSQNKKSTVLLTPFKEIGIRRAHTPYKIKRYLIDR